MGLCFKLSLLGLILIIIPYFLSLEHNRLDHWFKENGQTIGDILGVTSGWGFFGFWVGLWICPQSRFTLGYKLLTIERMDFGAYNISLGLILLAPASYLGFKGLMILGLKTSETHRPEKIVTTGVYGVVRHPQYLGGLFGHFGVSILLGSRDALLVTPLVLLAVYLLCWKEEKELLREFGEKYKQYQEKVPMFLPRR